MAAVQIEQSSLPDQPGKVAIITGKVAPVNLCSQPLSSRFRAKYRSRPTGGSSGIGYAAAKTLASLGAKVHILDLSPPPDEISGLEFSACNVTSWDELRGFFDRIGHVDMVFANAGVSEETDYFQNTFDQHGALEEPKYGVLGVNYRAVLNCIKLGTRAMKRQGTGGSIVITTSATAFAPE